MHGGGGTWGGGYMGGGGTLGGTWGEVHWGGGRGMSVKKVDFTAGPSSSAASMGRGQGGYINSQL